MNAFTSLIHLLKQPHGKTAEIHPFHGGVHPPENKAQSTQAPIGQVPLPSQLILPLRQHVGHLPKVLVKVGDHVLKGQLLAEPEGTVSAAVHAPTSGTITAIENAMIPHVSGLPDVCITLTPDGKETWVARKLTDWQTADRQAVIAQLRHSGVVGLGGATFPTQIKLRANTVHTLIINAAECEPYITCDDRLMRERCAEIVQGVAMAQHLIGAKQALIGIEDNKPEAIQAMQQATQNVPNIAVKVVPTLYPSGDARRLITLLTGIEVPHDGRATDSGVQVFNVATVYALYRFLAQGEPAISRIVSVTGNVAKPQNFEVLLGTPLAHLINTAGGAKAGTTHYIMGGPMMGFNLPSDTVPITKAANCIIAASPDLFAPPPASMPCIRCARCADACPVQLQPQELYWFAKGAQFEKARQYNLADCIECGACAYVCPSKIPLVEYYRYAKSEISALDRAKQAADAARERNEFRLARIEREKQERAQKHAERAQGAKSPAEKTEASAPNTAHNNGADDAKKAAIAAAIERAKALKAQAAAQGQAPKNTENLSASTQAEIQQIDAVREKAALAEKTSPTVDAEKQAKIEAAIARAKAMKAAKEAEQQKEN